jgi:two-component system, NarL family, sensor histidine kinase UhpB
MMTVQAPEQDLHQQDPEFSMISYDRPISILHLEDSRVDHELVKFALRRGGMQFEIVRVETLDEFLNAFNNASFDVVLADYRLPGFTAMDAWTSIATHSDNPPFIILSGAIGEAAAVDAVRQGISDYLLKDSMSKLEHVIWRALEVRDMNLRRIKADAELAASEKRLAELTEYLQMSIEQERAAIAREIHDDIGGSLAALKFDLAWISRHNTDPGTLAHVTAANEMLQHAIGASQRIMMNLRPAILDQGLVAAVQWLAASFERRTGVKVTFHTAHERIDTSKSVQLVAYRTAQEALTNISKYAQCTAVTIDMSDAEGVLTLEIADNGRGLSRSELEKPKAFGIKGLHERARTVGGWLDISSHEGSGTSIILSIPLANNPIEENRTTST